MNAVRWTVIILLFFAMFWLGWILRGNVERNGSAVARASADMMLGRGEALAQIKAQYDGTFVSFIDTRTTQYVQLGVMRVDAVTGIVGEGDATAKVDFRFHAELTDDGARLLRARGENMSGPYTKLGALGNADGAHDASVKFKRYDDGWRIE